MVVDPQPHMTYQPFLPEAAAGNISPRHTRGAAAAGAAPCKVRRRRRSRGSSTPARWPPCSRSSGPAREMPYDHVDRGARVGLPHPADPRPARARHRLQDHRRGDLPAQPRAGPARRGGGHAGPGRPPRGADLRLRRRWVRRHRGAGRDGGHGPRRPALLPGARAGRHALGAGRGDPADPARGRPGHGRVHGASSCIKREHGHPAGHPAGVLRRRGGRSCPTATSSGPTRSSGRPASSRRRCSDAHRLPARRPAAGSPACPPCRSSTATRSSRAPGAPATAPPCRT